MNSIKKIAYQNVQYGSMLIQTQPYKCNLCTDASGCDMQRSSLLVDIQQSRSCGRGLMGKVSFGLMIMDKEFGKMCLRSGQDHLFSLTLIHLLHRSHQENVSLSERCPPEEVKTLDIRWHLLILYAIFVLFERHLSPESKV